MISDVNAKGSKEKKKIVTIKLVDLSGPLRGTCVKENALVFPIHNSNGDLEILN